MSEKEQILQQQRVDDNSVDNRALRRRNATTLNHTETDKQTDRQTDRQLRHTCKPNFLQQGFALPTTWTYQTFQGHSKTKIHILKYLSV